MDSIDEEGRHRIAEILKEYASITEQLNLARSEYRKRFHELSARLLLQTRTWRSLNIRKRRLATEISELQRSCNNLMEDFIKVETQRIQTQQDLMRILTEIPTSHAGEKVHQFEKVNEFNIRELTEGLSLRWKILDELAIDVERTEAFVRGLNPSEEIE